MPSGQASRFAGAGVLVLGRISYAPGLGPRTTRVSVSCNGRECNHDSCGPSISVDGRHVVFASGARNLVPGDYNRALDVFVHDGVTGGLPA